jgi:hypothetical protein
MANTVRILITAKDEISGELDKIRDKATLLSKTDIGKGLAMGAGIAGFNMLKGAAMGALDSVWDFAKGSVAAAAEEEVGIKRLDASLKANIAGWDGNTAAIEKSVKARLKSGFADDAIRESLAKLVGSTRDVNKAFAIQATAMDLARFKGISLEAASTALIKVEGGQYRALKELGIVLKSGATQTEALAAVQRVAGGQMDAYMTTLAGKTELIKNRMEDLQEELGAKVTPALADTTEQVIGLMDALDGDNALTMSERFDTLTKSVGDFVGNASLYGRAWGLIQNSITEASVAGAEAWDTGSERVGASLKAVSSDADDTGDSLTGIGDQAKRAANRTKTALDDIVDKARTTRSDLGKIGSETADALFDPIILAADHAANAREQAEQRAIIAGKHSTKEQVRDAKARLTELQKTAFEQEVALIGYGKLNKKEQASFLADLKKRWKTATGEAKEDIADLIRAIEGLDRNSHVSISVRQTYRVGKDRYQSAAGNPLPPYSESVVGEGGPEIIRMGSVGGRVMPGAVGSSGGGGSVVLNVNVSTPAMTPGSAQALADAIAPAITRWQQVRGL